MIVLGIIVCLVVIILSSTVPDSYGRACEAELKANQAVVDYLRREEIDKKKGKKIHRKRVAGKSITYPACKGETK